MLRILKCIISKVFFKDVINKISFKVFSFNPWNIYQLSFLENVLSIKFPLNNFLSILTATPISKKPDVAHSILTLLKDQMWLIVC